MITQDQQNRLPDRPASIDLWPVEHLAAAAEITGMSPAAALAAEDTDQAAGKVTPAARLTCGACRTWASPAHLASPRHELAELRTALAGLHADLVAAFAASQDTSQVIVRMTAGSVRDRLAALLAGGRDA